MVRGSSTEAKHQPADASGPVAGPRPAILHLDASRDLHPPEPGPPPRPGPVASAAEVKAIAVERELGQLAAELGAGRDSALFRALVFYRKFLRRGRRYRQAPETFLKSLCDAFERRDIQTELAAIRAQMRALAEGTPARGPEPEREPTAVEIYRAAKGRGRARASATTEVAGAGKGAHGATPATGAPMAPFMVPPGYMPIPMGYGYPGAPAPYPMVAPMVPGAAAALAAQVAGFGPIVDGSNLAKRGDAKTPAAKGEDRADGAGSGSARTAVPSATAGAEAGSVPSPAVPEPAAKSDYAERRMRLPKITF